MSVSSVKNLNGETFSAVQDAELTTVVQTNSGVWNDISAYQNASGNYLTAIPNTVSISILSANDRVRVGNDASYKSYAHIDRNGLYFKNGNTRPYNIGIDSTGSNFYIATAQNGYFRIYASSISGWNDTTDVVQANSSTWAQGGSTSGLVSGTNVVKVPYDEGEPDGEYWSACISGDVKVATGDYLDETNYRESVVYSLSAIGEDIGNKLNKNTIENSKTLRSFNNVYEVFENAYKRTNFTNGSAYDVSFDSDNIGIYFRSNNVVNNSNLYSASIIVETTATGSIEADSDVWKILDFSNGSAVLTATYPAGIGVDYIALTVIDGWGEFTNCDATCTVYTSAELAPIAFKSDIPQINFVSTSSEATGTNILYVVTGAGA